MMEQLQLCVVLGFFILHWCSDKLWITPFSLIWSLNNFISVFSDYKQLLYIVDWQLRPYFDESFHLQIAPRLTVTYFNLGNVHVAFTWLKSSRWECTFNPQCIVFWFASPSWVRSHSNLKQTEPEFTWKLTETPVFKQTSLFVWSTPELGWVFTPPQTNRTIGGNAPGFHGPVDWTEKHGDPN